MEKRTLRYIFLLPAILGLAACAGNVREVVPEHGVEFEASWQGEQSSQQLEQGWLEKLNAPVLKQLVDEGLMHNRNLRANAARLEQAIAQAKISGAPLLPNASLGLSGNRSRNEQQNQVAYNSQISGSINVSWEADVWGRLSAQKAAALSTLGAAQADLHGGRLSLAAQVSQAWFDLIEARLQLEFAERTVESRRTSSGIVRKRYSSGLTTPLDLRLSLSALASSEANLIQRKSQFKLTARRLEVLLGRYPKGAIEAAASLPVLTEAVPVGIPGDLLARRPDLVAAQARLASMGYNIDAAKAALLPSISLTASLSSQGEKLSSLSTNNMLANLMANLSQPLFQGGRLRAQVTLNEAAFQEQLASYANLLLNAFREVEDALLAEKLLAEQEVHLEKAAEQAMAAEAIALRQYGTGLTQISPLLDSQRQSISAQSQLIGIRKQRLNNRVTLYLALGGDYSSADPAPVSEVN